MMFDQSKFASGFGRDTLGPEVGLRVKQIDVPAGPNPTWVYQTRFLCGGRAPGAPDGYRLYTVMGKCKRWLDNPVPGGPPIPPTFSLSPEADSVGAIVDYATYDYLFVNNPSLPSSEKTNWKITGAQSDAAGTKLNSVAVWYLYMSVSGSMGGNPTCTLEVKDFYGKALT